MRREVGLGEGGEGDVELALLEAEVGELLADGLAELGDDFAAFGGEGLAGAPEFGVELLELGVEAGQFGVALLAGFGVCAGLPRRRR